MADFLSLDILKNPSNFKKIIQRRFPATGNVKAYLTKWIHEKKNSWNILLYFFFFFKKFIQVIESTNLKKKWNSSPCKLFEFWNVMASHSIVTKFMAILSFWIMRLMSRRKHFVEVFFPSVNFEPGTRVSNFVVLAHRYLSPKIRCLINMYYFPYIRLNVSMHWA